jgi:hypothetical protein
MCCIAQLLTVIAAVVFGSRASVHVPAAGSLFAEHQQYGRSVGVIDHV